VCQFWLPVCVCVCVCLCVCVCARARACVCMWVHRLCLHAVGTLQDGCGACAVCCVLRAVCSRVGARSRAERKRRLGRIATHCVPCAHCFCKVSGAASAAPSACGPAGQACVILARGCVRVCSWLWWRLHDARLCALHTHEALPSSAAAAVCGCGWQAGMGSWWVVCCRRLVRV
jgi:hypothetical protein